MILVAGLGYVSSLLYAAFIGVIHDRVGRKPYQCTSVLIPTANTANARGCREFRGGGKLCSDR